MTATDERRDDDIALAGEYALHLLDADERRAFEERLAREPDLRALLGEWEEHFAGLSAEIASVAPPRHLKPAIEQRLFAAAKPARPRRSRIWLLGGLLTAAVLVLAFVALLPPSRPAGPAYVAEVAAEDRSLVVAARFDPVRGTLAVDRLAGGAAENRVLELWLIAEGAAAPVSLGVLPADPQAEIALAGEIIGLMAGGTLAISDEPPGGSPTGQPTGAVLAVGALSTL
ncbi:anti-sigma factor domain-containing protein [Albidovulum sediminicola]|uniref:Regulator of SigK n=1 Tax=Albidovulum sediminicola TaxID=2984331 RepID=A0ABT2Z5H0_9RHOB|nr:anti-sigma factor [Defluviimonas sp. WL0075]MCV2866379.1 anti-sigma factor [Defluviimonas sp. WL0075]